MKEKATWNFKFLCYLFASQGHFVQLYAKSVECTLAIQNSGKDGSLYSVRICDVVL